MRLDGKYFVVCFYTYLRYLEVFLLIHVNSVLFGPANFFCCHVAVFPLFIFSALLCLAVLLWMGKLVQID